MGAAICCGRILLAVGVEDPEVAADFDGLVERGAHFEHLLQRVDDVDVLEPELLEVLEHQSAGTERFLPSENIIERGVELVIDHDDEVAAVVEANGLEDGEAHFGEGARGVGLAGDREADDLVVGEMLGLGLGELFVPVINLGVEEGDALLFEALDEGSAPGALAAGTEQANGSHDFLVSKVGVIAHQGTICRYNYTTKLQFVNKR